MRSARVICPYCGNARRPSDHDIDNHWEESCARCGMWFSVMSQSGPVFDASKTPLTPAKQAINDAN